MKDLPLITIRTLVYNNGERIIETLETVKLQDYPKEKIQHIIVDDCSSDDSILLVTDWIRENNYNCQFIIHKENWGISRTINQTLSLTRGKYVCGTGDDLWHPNKLKIQVDTMEKLPEEYGLLCSNFYQKTVDGVISNSYFSEDFSFPEDVFLALIKGHLGYPIVVHSPTVLIKTSVYEEVGGYDEEMIQEDLEMWLRISLKKKIYFLKESLITYIVHPKSLSNNADRRETLIYHRIKVAQKYRYLLKDERNYNTSLSKFATKKIHELVKFLYKKEGASSRKIKKYLNEFKSYKVSRILKLAILLKLPFTTFVIIEKGLKKIFG